MRFLEDEVLTVPVGEVVNLTPEKIDQTGRSRSLGAIIVNQTQGDSADTTIAIRFGNDPDIPAFKYLPVSAGGQIRIEDYENLRDLRISLAGNTPAKLFVQYFN